MSDNHDNRMAQCAMRIIIKLHRLGASIRNIAKLFGMSKSSMARLVQLIDESSVAGAIDLFERERRNNVCVEAIADHLNLPAAVVLGGLNRMLLRAADDEASQMGQHDENPPTISTADQLPSVPNGTRHFGGT